MRNILIAALTLFIGSTAFAADSNPIYGPIPAFYAGIQGGYAQASYGAGFLVKNVTGVKSVGSVNSTGFGAHVYMGYMFNRYLGSEIGYTYLPDIEFKSVSGTSLTASPVNMREHLVVWVAKGFVPVYKKFGIFAKGGIAWANLSNTKVKYSDGSKEDSKVSKNRIVPVLGGGLNYQFDQNASADLSYMRYFKSGDYQTVNFYALGLAYTF